MGLCQHVRNTGTSKRQVGRLAHAHGLIHRPTGLAQTRLVGLQRFDQPHGMEKVVAVRRGRHVAQHLCQAAQLLDSPEGWGNVPPSVQRLAQRLGVSDRHVRRIFEARFGISPLQYLQTRRLLSAKHWLTDTRLPIHQIATLSGFASVRRFNAVFSEHYQLNPSALRRGISPVKVHAPHPGLRLKLAYRPPYDVAAMVEFFATRQITGLEHASTMGDSPSLAWATPCTQVGFRPPLTRLCIELNCK